MAERNIKKRIPRPGVTPEEELEVSGETHPDETMAEEKEEHGDNVGLMYEKYGIPYEEQMRTIITDTKAFPGLEGSEEGSAVTLTGHIKKIDRSPAYEYPYFVVSIQSVNTEGAAPGEATEEEESIPYKGAEEETA